MTHQYITDESGNVVAQFDGPEREPKESHTSHIVQNRSDFPGVDGWDNDYL